ncbi:hypothetical protein G6Y98_02555 [Clostridium perfringens]|uniref:phage tail protein n=1 Tax=Clostridium perfringens TaxID=1502 RepID=UPI0013E2CD39|nr:phage tail tape measure protein [Clostridium perfringens]NGT54728.1 hypothetical protein [Clostridium perfringens]NGT94696.1 hypothetical protein [Clostridium perfringens]
MEIFKLFGSIMVKNDKANESIDNTGKKAEGLGKKLISGIGTAAKWGAGLVAAAGAGATAMFGMATSAAGTTDRIDKLSQKLGMSRKTFQEWDFIASQSGLSVEQLGAGMKGLATKMDEAARGGKGATETFQRLGINVKDTSGKMKTQEQVFEEAVVKLQKMEDGTEKAALANKLFGKSGQELMPLLNGAAGSVEEMKKKAQELGLVLGDDAIDAGVLFTDTMDQLKRSFSSVVTQVGVSVMPVIQKFCDFILANMPIIQSVVSTVFKVIEFFVLRVVNVVQGLVERGQGVFTFFLEKLNLMKNAFNDSMEQFDDYGLAFKSMLEVLFGPIGDLPIFEEIGKIISAINEIKNRISNGEGIGEAFRNAFEWRDSTVGNTLIDFMDFCTNIFQSIELIIKTLVENSAPIFHGLQTLFEITMSYMYNAWENIGKPLFDFFAKAIQKLAEIFNYVFPIVADIFGGACDTINNLWVSILKPVLSAIGDFLKTVLLLIFTYIFNDVGEVVKKTFSFIGDLWNNSLKPILDGIINFIGGVFSGNWSQIWTGITQILSGLWGGIKTLLWSPIEWFLGKVGNILEPIISPFRSAAESIGNIWQSIRSKFKLPHFTFDGSMNPLKWLDEGLPKIGVEWYAKGAIMHKPTIFGINGPNAMVGGEAGPEAVAPISTLMDYVRAAVSEAFMHNNTQINYDKLFTIIKRAFIEAIKETGINNPNIILNGKKVSESLAGTNNKVDGQRIKLAGRGLALE